MNLCWGYRDWVLWYYRNLCIKNVLCYFNVLYYWGFGYCGFMLMEWWLVFSLFELMVYIKDFIFYINKVLIIIVILCKIKYSVYMWLLCGNV